MSKRKPIMLLLKTHVEGYTKKDGTVVAPHQRSGAASLSHEEKQLEKKHRALFQQRQEYYAASNEARRRGDKVREAEYNERAKKLADEDWKITRELDRLAGKRLGLKPGKNSERHQRGDSVHHPGHNRTGVILGVEGDSYHVRTVKGKERWHHKDVEKVHDYD